MWLWQKEKKSWVIFVTACAFVLKYYSLICCMLVKHARLCNTQLVVKLAALCTSSGHICNSIFRLESQSDECHSH